ncbi:MAG: right-handed parallel beta-helix repeat-containing protein, partial [Planctomycetes bacterium]|nr:right-handed parallel beta-helix repeat-containing protein [Planctomycetota bacterium]
MSELMAEGEALGPSGGEGGGMPAGGIECPAFVADSCDFLQCVVQEISPSLVTRIVRLGFSIPGATPPVYPSITEALMAASGSGVAEIISVQPDTYVEDVSIDLSDFTTVLMLISANGPATTTIAGTGTDVRTVTVTQSLAAGATFSLGTINSTASADKRGFTITGGDGGVGIIDVDADVKIRGNIISGNITDVFVAPFEFEGGGIGVLDSDSVVIAYNDIIGNELLVSTSGGRGAGIYSACSSLWIGENVIDGNVIAGEYNAPRNGGGVCVDGGNLVLCSNDILNNKSIQGAGVWIADVSCGPASDFNAHVESNQIEANLAYGPATGTYEWCQEFRGGGMYADAGDAADPTRTFNCRILLNRMAYNDINMPTTVVLPVVGCDIVHEQGGGLFVTGTLLRLVGGNFPPDTPCGETGTLCDQLLIEGNFIHENTARQGAGVWYEVGSTALGSPDVDDVAARGALYENTTARNHGDDPDGTGAGLFIAASSSVRGDGNVIDDNVGVPSAYPPDWWVECPQARTLPFLFGQMPMIPTAGDCPVDPFDLFGNDSDDADAVLVDDVDAPPHIAGASSPCIDTANDDLVLQRSADIDGDVRDIDVLGIQDDPMDPYFET